jgi:transcriptional regulator GlxA family with amidase domain
MTTFAIFVFQGAEELDWVGPLEVLTMWRDYWPDDGVKVFTLAQRPGVVTCAKGMRVLPDHTWKTAPPFDVLIYPGGLATREHVGDETILAWVRASAQQASLMTSVCSGSLVYADAGLLDGLPATSHWVALEELAKLGKDIEVRPDARFVDAGDVVTSAGVSAGIDMALHLVVRLHSEQRARDVKRAMQYDPQPPV